MWFYWLASTVAQKNIQHLSSKVFPGSEYQDIQLFASMYPTCILWCEVSSRVNGVTKVLVSNLISFSPVAMLYSTNSLFLQRNPIMPLSTILLGFWSAQSSNIDSDDPDQTNDHVMNPHEFHLEKVSLGYDSYVGIWFRKRFFINLIVSSLS